MSLTSVKLLGLFQFIQFFIFYTHADYTWPNELKSTKGYTEWSGGIVANHHRLRADQSPYFILNNVIVEDSAQLIIDPGVILKFAPKTGITIKGSIIANVTYLKKYSNKQTYFFIDYSFHIPLKHFIGNSSQQNRNDI